MTDAVFLSHLHDGVGPGAAPMPAVPGAARLWALVPCAGTGTRAATALPKQYQPIAGQALVLHTLAALAAVPRIAHTLVVVAAGDDFLDRQSASCRGNWSTAPVGGSTRARSVANGLAALQGHGAADADWVLVHDAARCLVTPELIERLIDACLDDAVGGLLALPVADTLKFADGERVVSSPDRNRHWLAQTPQMFRIGTLRAALQAAPERVTDESSAIEAVGLSPRLVRGSALNFKLTYPEDFLLAQALLLHGVRRNRQESDYEYP